MVKVLIASVNPWSFCMAVEREVAWTHRADRVDAIDLFKLCSGQSPHWRKRDRRIETANRKIARFVMSAINGLDITGRVRLDRNGIPTMPSTFDALRSFEVEGAKIGLATLSSLSSLTTIQVPQSLADYGEMLEPCWRTAHVSYRIGKAVRDLGYDKIYIFNGRHCYSRPFCDMAEQGSEVIRYEQGSAGNRYIAAPNSVHEPACLARLIEAHEFDARAGEEFFEERLAKDRRNEVSLITETQRQGALPAGFRTNGAVTFFTSSSDEMFAISDQTGFGEFPTQYDIALTLANDCKDRGLQAIIRLHPHLRFKHPAWQSEWNFAELRRRGALVLEPSDPCDSYALLRASRAIVTTGSTIGFEATYLGVPNAVVGDFLAGRLRASAIANSAGELAEFLADPRLLPCARERALLFGSFHKRGGKTLAALDVGAHPNLARVDGRIVDPVRYALQTLRFLLRGRPRNSSALDIRSGMQAGRVLLPPGTDYSSAL